MLWKRIIYIRRLASLPGQMIHSLRPACLQDLKAIDSHEAKSNCNRLSENLSPTSRSNLVLRTTRYECWVQMELLFYTNKRRISLESAIDEYCKFLCDLWYLLCNTRSVPFDIGRYLRKTPSLEFPAKWQMTKKLMKEQEVLIVRIRI